MNAGKLAQKDHIEIDKQEKVSKLIGSLKKNDASNACILDSKRFVGVFWSMDFLKSRTDMKNVKIDGFIKSVHRLDSKDSMAEIATQMLNSDSLYLPVFADDSLVGAIDIFDILKNLDGGDIDLVSRPFPKEGIAIGISDTLGQAISMLRENTRQEAIVIDNDDSIAGRLTIDQLLKTYFLGDVFADFGQRPNTKTRGFKAEMVSWMSLPVSNSMQKDIVRFSKMRSLPEIAAEMAQKRSLIAVSEDQKWIIQAEDILKALSRPAEKKEMVIAFKGLDESGISGRDIRRMHEIAETYAEKIHYLINNDFDIVIHVKTFRKQGSQMMHDISTRLNFPSMPITAKNQEWEPLKALRLGFDDIVRQIEGKFGKESQDMTPRKHYPGSPSSVVMPEPLKRASYKKRK